MFEALLNEGNDCESTDCQKECRETLLGKFQEVLLMNFLYPLNLISHETKGRNFTMYEPQQGENYLFVLNTTNNLKLFSCKVTPGVKFTMVIDIEDTVFKKDIGPDRWKSASGACHESLRLQESLDNFSEIMGKEKVQLEGEGGSSLENFEKCLEHVFDTCSSQLEAGDSFNLDAEYDNTHIFVVDSLSWWNRSMPCVVNITQASEENLQYLVNHKFLIQLLPIMIQSKDNEHKKELLRTNPEINLLIQKIPENIRDIVAELISTKNYDFTDLMELIPEHMEPLMVQFFE